MLCEEGGGLLHSQDVTIVYILKSEGGTKVEY